jgi:hypothetical protein
MRIVLSFGDPRLLRRRHFIQGIQRAGYGCMSGDRTIGKSANRARRLDLSEPAMFLCCPPCDCRKVHFFSKLMIAQDDLRY